MAITNFSELKTALSNWMTRPDVATQAEECISLAEAALNREIGAVETDATLTGTLDSRRIDISALNCVVPIGLFLAEASRDEVELTPQADGTFPYRVNSGYPRFWAIDGTNIDFDCPLDQAYPFRFRYRQKFALSDSAPTNWLLTNHPDVYLAAVLVWGGVFIQDDPAAARWVSILNSALPSVRASISKNKRAVLTVDPMLQRQRWWPLNNLTGWYP
ncbi:MAG: hypothetical protein E5X05_01285 [Mesorhizobium sp.]|nr:MAG: hypothetical protein E5X05_01285 [Mesorhizobium sp.]